MGELGFLGVRYPQAYGGSEMDSVATAILAEELGKSTFGGFAVTGGCNPQATNNSTGAPAYCGGST